MEKLEIEGLVLKKVDYGEGHRIINLLTENKGKLLASVKGIRKSKTRESFASDPLILGRYSLNKKSNSIIITKLSVEKPYIKIREDYFKLQISLYILKVLDKITFEDIESKKIYNLAINSLDYLEKSQDKQMILIMLSYFLYRLIKLEGLEYNIEGREYFQLDKGRVSDVYTTDAIRIDEYQFEYLKLLNTVDIEAINKLQSNNKNILGLVKVLEKYINYNLCLDLKIHTYLGEEIL